jgi:hypothetical protein
MKRILYFISIATFLLIYGSCEKSETGTGTLNLSITDAPIDTDGIESVYITITGIQYHTISKGWVTVDEFEGPKMYNLLDLTRGTSDLLGSFELSSGTYTQIRFLLDMPVYGQGITANPGCYLEFEDGSTQPLFVPSGAQTGYKAVGAFHVPINGEVDVTADFDVRKSVVKAGNSGMYILKPTIRLIVDNQAGSIKGKITGIEENTTVVVYAYESGTYNESEADEPQEEATRFPNAVSSDVADEEEHYHIAFLASGSYDLVIAITDENEEVSVVAIIENVEVESNKATIQNIELNNIE